MLQRPRKLAQKLKVRGARDDPAQQRHHARQRHRRIRPRADLAQQVRHQVIQHLTAARANGALVQLKTEIGNQRHHAMARVVG